MSDKQTTPKQSSAIAMARQDDAVMAERDDTIDTIMAGRDDAATQWTDVFANHHPSYFPIALGTPDQVFSQMTPVSGWAFPPVAPTATWHDIEFLEFLKSFSAVQPDPKPSRASVVPPPFVFTAGGLGSDRVGSKRRRPSDDDEMRDGNASKHRAVEMISDSASDPGTSDPGTSKPGPSRPTRPQPYPRKVYPTSKAREAIKEERKALYKEHAARFIERIIQSRTPAERIALEKKLAKLKLDILAHKLSTTSLNDNSKSSTGAKAGWTYP